MSEELRVTFCVWLRWQIKLGQLCSNCCMCIFDQHFLFRWDAFNQFLFFFCPVFISVSSFMARCLGLPHLEVFWCAQCTNLVSFWFGCAQVNNEWHPTAISFIFSQLPDIQSFHTHKSYSTFFIFLAFLCCRFYSIRNCLKFPIESVLHTIFLSRRP